MISSVFVIILTWNHIADTMECLDSVLKTTYPEIKIVVVDNASTDKTVEIISEKYPSIFLLQNQKNLGYAEGNNVGIRYALDQNADFVLVLNNDTVIQPDTITLLIEDLLQNPNTVAVSPKSYFYDSPKNIYFAGGIITELGKAKHLYKAKDDCQGYQTEWLNGCALMLRAEYLEMVGLFSPLFFLMFEDVDWSLRAKKCGFDLRVAPLSTIKHKASISFDGPSSPMQIYYYVRNCHLWYERNYPISQRIFYHANKLKQDFKSIKKTIKILFAYTPTDKAIRQAYFDYVFRRFYDRYYLW